MIADNFPNFDKIKDEIINAFEELNIKYDHDEDEDIEDIEEINE
jgi:hypothetical protein